MQDCVSALLPVQSESSEQLHEQLLVWVPLGEQSPHAVQLHGSEHSSGVPPPPPPSSGGGGGAIYRFSVKGSQSPPLFIEAVPLYGRNSSPIPSPLVSNPA
ncbi:hypothetical protein ACFLZ6_01510 [Nanoarchaeota archaeon]